MAKDSPTQGITQMEVSFKDVYGVLCVCIFMHHVPVPGACRGQRATESPGSGVTDSCETF